MNRVFNKDFSHDVSHPLKIFNTQYQKSILYVKKNIKQLGETKSRKSLKKQRRPTHKIKKLNEPVKLFKQKKHI